MSNWLVDELVRTGASYEETCVRLAQALEKPIRVLAAKRVRERANMIRDRLDEICEETARVLGMPTVLVTLIDDAHVQFIGAYGTEHATVPVQIGVCPVTTVSDAPLLIDDAMNMVTVPVVTENAVNGGARAYLGAPWHASNQPIGTVCAYGPEPREWTDEETAFIETQARRVEELVALLV